MDACPQESSGRDKMQSGINYLQDEPDCNRKSKFYTSKYRSKIIAPDPR